MTRYNKTAAVLIPKRDLDRLEDCEEKQSDEDEEAEAAPAPKRARAGRG